MRKAIFAIIFLFACLQVAGQDISGSWNGVLEAGPQKLGIIFHFEREADGGPVAKMDVPEQGLYGLELAVKCMTEDSVSVEAAALMMDYTGKREGDAIVGTFRQMGASFPLNLAPGAADQPSRPQIPQEPYPYPTEEVSFQNTEAGVSLGGTLTYPAGYVEGDRPLVVLMVTGSGAQDRDEQIFGHRPFLVIADYLARHGIASLRYDDRGVGASTGNPSLCTSLDFEEDAASGVKMLNDMGRFGKVGVLGHSEGGMIAFVLAAEGKVDFVVSLAGPGIKGDTLLAEQQTAILATRGLKVETTAKQVRQTLESSGRMNPWLEFFMDYDPKSDLEKIAVPVMAVNGSNDMQVLSGSNLKAISGILSGKNDKNLIKEYPDLNHLFQHCTPQTAMDYYNIEETISEEVLSDIAAWINSL